MNVENPIASQASDVERFLDVLEARMLGEVVRVPAAWPARMLLQAGGKRLRARLLWWSANATTTRPLRWDDHDLVRAAAAVELAHLSSLIHDDVVDGADTRRGICTLHRAHGLEAAIATGAALAHVASGLIAGLSAEARRTVRRTIVAICRGQVRELAMPFVVLPPRRRLAIMQEKTAAFFEMAAALGALMAGAEARQRAAVRRFARRLGVAFQIADDVLDLTGDPRELGRANGADLREGVFTLPVLLASDPDGRLGQGLRSLHHDATPELIATCTALITRGDGVSRAAAIADWWLESAMTTLDLVVPSSSRSALRQLAVASVARGLKPGPPAFAGSSESRRPTGLLITTSFASGARVEALSSDPEHARRLTRSLEWMHPGLSALVADAMAGMGSVADSSERLLLRNADWSPRGRLAARAIALAHALGHERVVRGNPVRALALADCLHCIAIATLCEGPDPAEHARLARRARRLGTQRRADVALGGGRPRRPTSPTLPLTL